MSSGDRRFEKEYITPSRLPVAKKYVYPTPRGRLFAIGGIALLAVAAPFLADAFFGRATTVSNGDLSESHALFGKECSTCHVPLQGVPDASCESCHEKTGARLGTFGFDRHYAYRSGDYDRSAPASSEISCAGCHGEHQGRSASLQRVADMKCQSCHTDGSFEEGHPEFAFASEGLSDESNLRFPHVLHVREIVAEEELRDMEGACFSCHEPEAGGRSFQPISFERHCDACHITASESTPYLPSGAGAGVSTLAQIRAQAGPASLWANYSDPNEFRDRGGEVQKRPVYHEDPWILYNLRKLRRDIYPSTELADLLRSSADVPAGKGRVLHEEAIASLEAQIQALRGEPSRDVQDELQALTELLGQVRRRLDDPYAPVDETRFRVNAGDQAGTVDVAAYQAVVDSLTGPCQSCHVVEKATIKRVQTDQRALARAEFDHGDHVIHARCLDCHSGIPVREFVAADEDAPVEVDRAEIQNLPTIATCQSCHSGKAAPDQCTSCHLFHPDKSQAANLSRYHRAQ